MQRLRQTTYLEHRRGPCPDSPNVTIQLPIFNEKHVVSRLIEAVCTLDYDLDKLNIQVLDDSTDDTRVQLDRAVHYWTDRGRSIKVIRRKHRHGFKAGALEEGMPIRMTHSLQSLTLTLFLRRLS